MFSGRDTHSAHLLAVSYTTRFGFRD